MKDRKGQGRSEEKERGGRRRKGKEREGNRGREGETEGDIEISFLPPLSVTCNPAMRTWGCSHFRF